VQLQVDSPSSCQSAQNADARERERATAPETCLRQVRQDIQGAGQAEGAHQDTLGCPYISLRILWQRTEKSTELKSPHVHSRPQERVYRLWQILLNSSYLEYSSKRQTRNEHLALFIKMNLFPDFKKCFQVFFFCLFLLTEIKPNGYHINIFFCE